MAQSMVQTEAQNNTIVLAETEAQASGAEPEVQVMSIVVRKPQSKSLCAFKKRARAAVNEKSGEEATADAKKSIQSAETHAERLAEKEAAQEMVVQETWKEFEQSRADVEDAMDAELQAAKAYGELLQKKRDEHDKIQQMHRELADKQKMLAVMEFMQSNEEKLKLLQESRKKAEEELQRFKQQQKDMKLEQRKLFKDAQHVSDESTGTKRKSDTCIAIDEQPEKRRAGEEPQKGEEESSEDKQDEPEKAREQAHATEESHHSEGFFAKAKHGLAHMLHLDTEKQDLEKPHADTEPMKTEDGDSEQLQCDGLVLSGA